MSTPSFDIDISQETPELLEIAKNQLRETSENRQAGFKQLRELLKQNPDLNCRDDDEFLAIILRCCHWHPEGAIKLLRRIAEFRKENEKLVEGLLPEHEKVAFMEGNIMNMLTHKDHLGRRVVIVNSGKLWNTDKVSADQLFRLFYLIQIVVQLEKSSQINGVVVIMDFEGLSMKQIKAMTPSHINRLLTCIQEAMPLRLKAVHFVNQPTIFSIVWPIFKPFVKEKLRKRMFFHGHDREKLHKHIPAEFLPKKYGGTLPEMDYSGKDWYPCLERYNQYFLDWASFGFK